jgi:hypothetical protein
VTKLKLQSKLNAGAAKALDPHVQALFDNPGDRIMGVVAFNAPEGDDDE